MYQEIAAPHWRYMIYGTIHNTMLAAIWNEKNLKNDNLQPKVSYADYVGSVNYMLQELKT